MHVSDMLVSCAIAAMVPTDRINLSTGTWLLFDSQIIKLLVVHEICELGEISDIQRQKLYTQLLSNYTMALLHEHPNSIIVTAQEIPGVPFTNMD